MAEGVGMTPEQIVELWRQRKADGQAVRDKMLLIREAYEGRLDVVLPDMDRHEQSAVANLFQSGLDQLGMRVASTLPDVFYPPVRPGFKESEERARQRRRATLGWWEQNALDLKMRQRARFFIGHASAPVVIRPDSRNKIPRWDVRDPLTCFPAPTGDVADMVPGDCIFAFPLSLAQIRARFGEPSLRGLDLGRDPRADDRFDVLEYVSETETVLVVVGKSTLDGTGSTVWYEPTGTSCVEVQRLPNRLECCPVVIPGRITLGSPMGQFDGLVGMYQMQARLMALEVIAVEKGVFPDMFLVSRPNETAQLIGGLLKDGRTGEINILKGGEYTERGSQPGFQTNPTIDRLERNMRITAGVPAEFGGESQSNVRTGKRGDAIMSAVVDFPVQEAQTVLARALQEENKIAVAMMKAFWGSTPKHVYVDMKGARGNLSYVPNEVFETDTNVVTYSAAGADINALVISGGQRVGIGTMSKRSFQELDPLVHDAETEHDRVTQESIEAALLSSIQTQAASGAIPPADLARIMELIVTQKTELAEAVMQAQREAQERQATPVPAEAPAAQPGLSLPGMGAEAPIEAPPQGSQNLSSLLSSLRSPQRTLPVERTA